MGAVSRHRGHQVYLKKVKELSPLSKLLNKKLNEPQLRKNRFLANTFEHFHMKNTVTSAVQGRQVIVNDKEVINFGSANYLGLDQNPEVIEAVILGAKKYGNHSGCSRIFSTQDNLVNLENILSDWLQVEKTLIYANVSQTHQGVIPTLFSTEDVEIFIDHHAHTSMYQAAQIAKAKGAATTRVNTENLDDLEITLKESKKPTKVLLLDGIYSMQGHYLDLLKVQAICDKYSTILYVDDAHGIGILGDTGAGVKEMFNLDSKNLILVGSLQKGVGCYGAFVAGSATLIDILKVSSKPYIFSGTLQPHSVEGAIKAIEIVRSEAGRHLRHELRERSKSVRSSLESAGFKTRPGDSPIVPIEIGDDLTCLMVGRCLFDSGYFVNSVMYPAVPKNKAILRISLNTLHAEREVQGLLEAIISLQPLLKLYESKLKKTIHISKEVVKSKLPFPLTGIF